MNINFKNLSEKDLSLIYKWFKKKHVKQFYSLKNWTLEDIAKKYNPYIKNLEPIYAYIINIDDIPIGYIQYYYLKEYPFDNQNLSKDIIDKTAGIDFYIGDENYINKGYGKKVISKFLQDILKNKFKYCIADPDTRNIASIKMLEKLDFKTHKMIPYKNQIGEQVLLQLMIKKI